LYIGVFTGRIANESLLAIENLLLETYFYYQNVYVLFIKSMEEGGIKSVLA
jgi:hypothetical protein